MGVIYQTRGRAREFCELACNLYNGCEHGCLYCWAPAVTYKTREDFKLAMPRQNIVQKVEKEAYRYAGKKVLLCFTSDPYQPIEEEFQITRQVLQIFLSCGVIPVILTKGKLADRDFDILQKFVKIGPIRSIVSWFGLTLTFFDDLDREKWEPNAATIDRRLTLLAMAWKRHINTWVSLEPVIDPKQTLALIQETHRFVDLYKVGTLNYHEHAKTIDWHKFYVDVTQLLTKLNKKYYIKKDLRRYA